MTAARLLFPCLATIVALVAYFAPGIFSPYRDAVVPVLAAIMFAMGLTLRLADFHGVVARPAPVVLGVALQFSVMPLGSPAS